MLGARHLVGLAPAFRAAVEYLVAYCEAYDVTVELYSGYRDFEAQRQLYAQGRTPYEILHRVRKQGRGGSVTDAPPGSSAHNYGLAVDIVGETAPVVHNVAQRIGFGIVSWDPAHIEWPHWQRLVSQP